MEDVLARYGITRKDLVRALGVRAETVRLWCSDQPRPGRKAPTSRPSAKNALAIERLLGVPRWEMRPDLWEPPAARASAPARACDGEPDRGCGCSASPVPSP